MDVWTNRWMYRQTDGCIDKQMDVWTNRWMYGHSQMDVYLLSR